MGFVAPGERPIRWGGGVIGDARLVRETVAHRHCRPRGRDVLRDERRQRRVEVELAALHQPHHELGCKQLGD